MISGQPSLPPEPQPQRLVGLTVTRDSGVKKKKRANNRVIVVGRLKELVVELLQLVR